MRPQRSLRAGVVATAVGLISTSSRTLVRFDLTGARCRLTGAPDFTHDDTPLVMLQRFCEGCPVQAMCLAAALVEESPNPRHDCHFVRGGMVPAVRAALIGRLQDEGVL